MLLLQIHWYSPYCEYFLIETLFIHHIFKQNWLIDDKMCFNRKTRMENCKKLISVVNSPCVCSEICFKSRAEIETANTSQKLLGACRNDDSSLPVIWLVSGWAVDKFFFLSGTCAAEVTMVIETSFRIAENQSEAQRELDSSLVSLHDSKGSQVCKRLKHAEQWISTCVPWGDRLTMDLPEGQVWWARPGSPHGTPPEFRHCSDRCCRP